jgi:transposase-like protein
MRKAYTTAQKQEAVALARVMGAEAAGKQLGIDPRTIVKWMSQAGDRPELDGDAGTWQRLFDLAHARTEAALASGKLSAQATATVMAIAQRNLEKLRDKPAPPESAVAAREAFYGWLEETTVATMGSDPAEIDATVDALESINRMLIVRANAEHGQPHRPAILAWFSNRPETPAGDVGMWAREIVRGLLVEHGTLAAWHAADVADQERRQPVRHDAMEAHLERNPSTATAVPPSKQPLSRSREAGTELER